MNRRIFMKRLRMARLRMCKLKWFYREGRVMSFIGPEALAINGVQDFLLDELVPITVQAWANRFGIQQ